jgi:membrane-associated PAP2 superfamily phosphatase
LAGFVFSAGFACKASFVANTCHRPQGRRNGLFQKPAKNGYFLSFMPQNVQKLAFMMQNNAFFDLACWLYALATLWLMNCGSPLNTCPF